MIALDQPLHLHPLTFLEEGDEVTAGRADIDSYGMFPADGAALLRRLAAGSPPNEAAAWYTEQYGERVDISEFLEVLDELRLIVGEGETTKPAAKVRWQGLGRAVFSRPAWACYALLVAAAIAAMIREPYLLPDYHHLFFTRSSLVLLTLGIVLGQVPWLMLHEAFHALAGRFAIIDQMRVIPGSQDRASAAETFRRLYWDTALSWGDPVLRTLREVVGIDHVVFGSDYPYLRRDLAVSCREQIEASPELTDRERTAVLGGTAAKLIPRLARPALRG